MAGKDRLFVIHAGTHKTASTYIQSRIKANSDLLLASGVYTAYPEVRSRKYKPLSSALVREKWGEWRQYLESIPASFNHALVSAEQFTQPLANPESLGRLTRLLGKYDFRLKVIVFLRDQPDYINARYVHSARRLYHDLEFEDYVCHQLRDRSRIFDYDLLFSEIVDFPGVELCFLPYASGLSDPFERLLSAQGLLDCHDWHPSKDSQSNVQPGRRGVWLAKEVKRILDDRSEKSKRLGQLSRAIREIAGSEGWTADRFFGFDEALLAHVVQHYAVANDRFARKVWGRAWGDVYPRIHAQQSIYKLPKSGHERDHMLGYVDHVLRRLPAG